MEKKIAILQPNYIPWKGVFDLINRVDVFVFYDDVQYTIKDWRNRNIIKTPHGLKWLTVPVISKGRKDQLICDTKIGNYVDWQKKHYKSIRLNYAKAKHFKDYEYILEEIYLTKKWEYISDLNIYSTKLIAEILNIEVDWHKSSELNVYGDNKDGERVIKICDLLSCNYFINGPSSRAFLNEKLFNAANIGLEYMKYNYPEYEQLYPPFEHHVSVLDLIFNEGQNAAYYMKSLG